MAAPLETPLRALIRPGRRALAALGALLALVALGAVTLLALRPPAPEGTGAPADEFSAGRAYPHVATIAADVRVAGSPAADRAREHVVATLSGLGLETEVQDTVAPEAGQLTGVGGTALARVRNVVARLPGTDPTGRVFVVSHYDSVQAGPGGNDAATPTAAILEVARALAGGPRPRNDIVFVLTDAEEACLCGAAAFAQTHPLAAGGGVVLNLEARGRTGPVIMFETSRDNARLVEIFGRSAPHPVGTSFAVEIYRLLPNDTDFTAFLDKRFTGLNAAYIDGSAIYHTPQDTPASVDRASLQHHGENALALARALGAADIPTLRAEGDATYFPVPGGLVRYPAALIWPLAALALVAVAALAWLARRRERTTWPRLAAGFGLALAPILLAPTAAQLFWAAVTTIRPGYAGMPDPHRPLWFRMAVLALAAAVLFAWYALTRRRVGAAALAIGGLGWLAVLGIVMAAVVPGGSYLTTLPALAGAAAGLVALALRPAGPWGVVALTAGAAVAVLILLPTVVLLFPALGMATGGAAALFAVLLGLAALPLLDLLHPEPGGHRGLAVLAARRATARPALAAALAALVLATVGLVVDRFDAAHPAPTHLMYALDAGTGQARWLSHENDPHEWTAQYVASSTAVPDFPALGDDQLRSGPAPAAALPAPLLDVLADTTANGVRTLRLRLRPQRSVRLAALHVDAATAGVRAATVAGRPVEPVRDGRWSFGLVFHAPPPQGIEISLALEPRGGPVRLRAMDGSDGLGGLPGFRPRPSDIGIAGTHSSELLAVAKTYSL